MPQKLPVDEILALCRQQDGDGAGSGAAAGGDAPAETAAPAAEAAPAAPDVPLDPLAAARAQGAAKPAGDAPVDPLAAARAQGAAKPAGEKLDPLAAARAQGAAKAAGEKLDPLAAARAQGAAGGAKPKATAAPAAKATPAAAAAPTEKLSVDEMLARLRAGDAPKTKTAPAAEAAPVEPAKPRLPSKPLPRKTPVAKAAPEGETDRRGFFGWLASSAFGLAWVFFGIVSGIGGLALARFFFPNTIVAPPSKFKIGSPGDYPLNSVSTKWKPQFGVWIVHTNSYNGENLIYALASVCTHLGCTPSWLEGEQKFKCPCHGSGFYMNGINFEGPAPRPLERVGLTKAPDGQLEVDKSLKFQEELGQWNDNKSFVVG